MSWSIKNNGLGFHHIYHIHDEIGVSCYERISEFSKQKNPPTCCLCNTVTPDSVLIQWKILQPGSHGVKKEQSFIEPGNECEGLGINYEGELFPVYNPVTLAFRGKVKVLLDKYGVNYVDNERS